MALSRTRCDNIGSYMRSDFSLNFLGQFFYPPCSQGCSQWGVVAESQQEEVVSRMVETFLYQLIVDDGDQPSPPSPCLDPAQFQRLNEPLRFEVLKKCSAQTLCELIGGRINKEFCELCEEALQEVLKEKVLKVVDRALALDRLRRVQEVDSRVYWKCSSTKLRAFPSPVISL